MTSVPAPLTFAPIAFKHWARSTTSDPRTLETLCASKQVPVLDIDLGAHRLQPLDVLIHRTQADGAPAGKTYPGLAAARDERAQDEDRRPHGLDEVVRRERIRHRVRAQLVSVGPGLADPQSHLGEQSAGRRDVAQLRHILDRQTLAR
jgi:hypothetical protein